MPSCRRKFHRELQDCRCWNFRDLLAFERERSERHNRFFSVFGLTMTGLHGVDLAGEIRAELRSSDYVLTLPDWSEERQRVGILLPETDLRGAQTVRKRLVFLCSLKGDAFELSLAVYPDDATTPDGLMFLAFPAGKPVEAAARLNPTFLPGGA